MVSRGSSLDPRTELLPSLLGRALWSSKEQANTLLTLRLSNAQTEGSCSFLQGITNIVFKEKSFFPYIAFAPAHCACICGKK